MSGGVGAALGEAVAAAGAPGEVDQGLALDLFAALDETDHGALDAPSPLSALVAPPKRGGGRRPGSVNKRREATTAWLLSQHRHPLSVMMEAYSMTPDELARRIGIKDVTDPVRIELLKLQLRMAEAVAPYVAQRQAQAVQVDAKGQVTLAFSGVNLPARGGGGQDLAVVEGEVLGVRLPFKSDDRSRIDGQPTE